jgi:hypothetical protein
MITNHAAWHIHSGKHAIMGGGGAKFVDDGGSVKV